MMGIFSGFAPLYWGAGLPVIPLRQRNKMPDITGWQQFGTEMPSEMVREHWLTTFANGNIGLPFGPASGLCAIDIDTDDEDLIKVIRGALPPTPWVRRGKKGMGLIYGWQGQKNFKLRGADGGMLCEFLGLGNQMVLPPSIHPETGLAYEANSNLWEVIGEIQPLDADIEDKLRALLGKAGFNLGAGGRSSPLDVVPAGERDVQLVRHAGYLARVVLGIDKSAAFTLAEAIAQIYHWVEHFPAKVAGDVMDPNKGVAKLLEFLLKDIEAGRTLPEAWDSGLPDDWRNHPTIKLLGEKNEAQRWTVARAREWLGSKISDKPNDDDWAIERVQEVVAKCAADEHFTEFNMRTLVSYILAICKGLPLKKSDLMALFKAEKKGSKDGSGDEETQESIASGVLEYLQREGEIRYDHSQFWQWNGACFERMDEDGLYKYVAMNVKGSQLARRNSDYEAIVKVMRRLVKGSLMECEDRGLNFANGFVGEDLRLVDHDPKFGATFTLPFEYHAELASKANRWGEFLYSVWGHEPDYQERVQALQEMFAATLFKIAWRYQRAFLLYGRASTGKTQILHVLRALLPKDAISDLGPQKWGDRFGLTDLIGKAANICGELPENGMIVGNMFKQIVEGDVTRSEFKGMDGFSFKPECSHWFASNYLPVSRDSSRGFTRRWLILDFNKPVKDEDKIENLAESIVAEEREAIAAWALEGLRRVIERRGYTEPECHHKRTAQMRRINNSVQAFLEDHAGIEQLDGAVMLARDAYDQYAFHMKDVGRGQPVSFERFLQMVEDLELDVSRDRDPTGTIQYHIHGVRKVERLEKAA